MTKKTKLMWKRAVRRIAIILRAIADFLDVIGQVNEELDDSKDDSK